MKNTYFRLKSLELLCFVGFSNIALAAEFNYKIHDYRSSSSCLVSANQIALKFQEVTGITPERAHCIAKDGDGYDISLLYQAAEPLTFHSTEDVYLTYGKSIALYGTREECEAELGTFTSTFAAKTGLTPIVSYCRKDPYLSTNPWGARVDSFGSAPVTPIITGVNLFEYPVSTTILDLEVALTNALRARGVDAQFSVMKSAGALVAFLNVFAYAPANFPIERVEHAQTDTQEQCMAQLNELLTIYGGELAADGAPLTSYCGAVPVSAQWYVVGFHQMRNKLNTQIGTQRFPTYDACMAARQSVIEEYRDVGGMDVRGATCTLHDHIMDPSDWRVNLHTLPRQNP